MAQKRNRGYKPPANYEPGRKPAGRKFHGGGRQDGGRGAAGTEYDTERPGRGAGRGAGRGGDQGFDPDRVYSRGELSGDRAGGARVFTFGSNGEQRGGRGNRDADERGGRGGRDAEQRGGRGGELRGGRDAEQRGGRDNSQRGGRDGGARGGRDFEQRGARSGRDAGQRETRGSRDSREGRGYDSRAGREAERRSGAPVRRAHTYAQEPAPRLDAKVTTAAAAEGVSWADLGLGGNIVRVLGELGADQPFPIQVATIPDTIKGRNVLGRANTGSGKTIAFGASLVERLLMLKANGAFSGDASAKSAKAKRGVRAPQGPTRNPKALILAPTRELALQIDRTIQPIARSVGFYTAQLVGGIPIEPQIHALERGVDIIIGTPGRVQDLIDRRRLDLREVQVSILDEADHMCELGFLEPVQKVLRQTERGGQRLLFSATLDTGVSELVREFLKDPAVHEAEAAATGNVRHRVYTVTRDDKDAALINLATTPGSVLVFCRTKVTAERLAMVLSQSGLRVASLHGDLSQSRRERNLQAFSSGKASVLVATDVAARGIHVDDVDLVIQADPPNDFKIYLHRAGRTGRAGNDGIVISLVPPHQQERAREMLREAEIKPEVFTSFASKDDPSPRKSKPGAARSGGSGSRAGKSGKPGKKR